MSGPFSPFWRDCKTPGSKYEVIPFGLWRHSVGNPKVDNVAIRQCQRSTLSGKWEFEELLTQCQFHDPKPNAEPQETTDSHLRTTSH